MVLFHNFESSQSGSKKKHLHRSLKNILKKIVKKQLGVIFNNHCLLCNEIDEGEKVINRTRKKLKKQLKLDF